MAEKATKENTLTLRQKGAVVVSVIKSYQLYPILTRGRGHFFFMPVFLFQA